MKVRDTYIPMTPSITPASFWLIAPSIWATWLISPNWSLSRKSTKSTNYVFVNIYISYPGSFQSALSSHRPGGPPGWDGDVRLPNPPGLLYESCQPGPGGHPFGLWYGSGYPRPKKVITSRSYGCDLTWIIGIWTWSRGSIRRRLIRISTWTWWTVSSGSGPSRWCWWFMPWSWLIIDWPLKFL